MTFIIALRTVIILIFTVRMMPVSPMPPTVAWNASGSLSGVSVRSVPVPSMSSISSIQAAMLPSACWFLPCTSAATAPPTVRWPVPGSTGRIRPSGTALASTSAKVADAEARTVPAATSSSTVGWVTGMTTCPSRFCAASP